MLRVPQNPVPTDTMLDCLDHLQFDLLEFQVLPLIVLNHTSLTEPSVSLYSQSSLEYFHS